MGTVVEELVGECLGKDGHRMFLEEDNLDEISVRQTSHDEDEQEEERRDDDSTDEIPELEDESGDGGSGSDYID